MEYEIIKENERPESNSDDNCVLKAVKAGLTPPKYFDVDLAQTIINKEFGNGIKFVEAGLDGDWGNNSQTIYRDGDYGVIEYRRHDNSIWAIPCIRIFYKDGTDKTFACYKGER